MKRFEHYSEEAVRLFSKLSIDSIMKSEQCSGLMPRHTWMHMVGEKEESEGRHRGMFIPLLHSNGEGSLVAAQLIMRKPDFIFNDVQKLTALQAIEVKARSMLIGDIVVFFTEMTHDGMLPPLNGDDTWLVTIRNPYWFLVNEILRLGAEQYPEHKAVMDRLPEKCRVLVTDGAKAAPQETYAVRIRISDDADITEHGCIKRPDDDTSPVSVGVALADKPWVSAYDVSSVSF
jgi:hypothetical protein